MLDRLDNASIEAWESVAAERLIKALYQARGGPGAKLDVWRKLVFCAARLG